MQEDNTYQNRAAYQLDLNSKLYSQDSPEGKAFREAVNKKLSQSPNMLVDDHSGDGRKRRTFLKKDGLQ